METHNLHIIRTDILCNLLHQQSPRILGQAIRRHDHRVGMEVVDCRTRDVHEVFLASPCLLVEALRQIHQSTDVELKSIPDGSDTSFEKRLHLAGGGGIEDEDVSEDIIGFERVEEARRVREAGDIADHGDDGGAVVGGVGGEGGSCGLEDIFAAAEEDEVRGLGLDEGAGDGEADARRASGDEDGFAGLAELGAEWGDGGVGRLVVGFDGRWAKADGVCGCHFDGVWLVVQG